MGIQMWKGCYCCSAILINIIKQANEENGHTISGYFLETTQKGHWLWGIRPSWRAAWKWVASGTSRNKRRGFHSKEIFLCYRGPTKGWRSLNGTNFRVETGTFLRLPKQSNFTAGKDNLNSLLPWVNRPMLKTSHGQVTQRHHGAIYISVKTLECSLHIAHQSALQGGSQQQDLTCCASGRLSLVQSASCWIWFLHSDVAEDGPTLLTVWDSLYVYCGSTPPE